MSLLTRSIRTDLIRLLVVPLVLLHVILLPTQVTSFVLIPNSNSRSHHHRVSSTSLASSTKRPKHNNNKNTGTGKKQFTLQDLRREIEQKPASFLPDNTNSNGEAKKSNYRRSRKRAQNPKQQYVYAKQRQQQNNNNNNQQQQDDTTTPVTAAIAIVEPPLAVTLARDYGLTQPASQHCDALVDTQPVILGQIRVEPDDDDTTTTSTANTKSGSYAYIIDKPAGWAILGGAPNNKKAATVDDEEDSNTIPEKASSTGKKQMTTRLEITDEDGSRDVLEYNEADLLAIMTPEEVEQYKAETIMAAEDAKSRKITTQKVQVRVDQDTDDEEFLFLAEEEDKEEMGEIELQELETIEQEEREILSAMTQEELQEYVQEVGPLPEHFLRYQRLQQQQAEDVPTPLLDSIDKQADDETTSSQQEQQITRLEITDEDGSMDVLEYSEADLLAVMTPEEVEEYKANEPAPKMRGMTTKKVQVRTDDDSEEDDEEFLSLGDADLGEMQLEEELDDIEMEAEVSPNNEYVTEEEAEQHSSQHSLVRDDKSQIDVETAQVLSKIQARSESAAKSKTASFAPYSRPSVVAWLKELKAQEGKPMKGGKYWTALAGATEVDDSGILILCPKEYTDNVFVDYLEYVAVIGNDKNLAPKPKNVVSLSKDALTIDIASTLRRGRREDTVQTVKVMVPEQFSSCNSIIQACQKQFQDGIRGDPAGNPLGRLANRRLLHCNAVSISSLVHDESEEVETERVTDDIAILAERRNQQQYQEGSFLGRSELQNNPLTTAYREINGAADGFPGWTVDRYGKWLLVQHDDKMPRGPLPSIHDGNTVGIYYLTHHQDRSAMGSGGATLDSSVRMTRPILLEGQPAPDAIDILENGVTYQVSLDKDLSTGIFLDQRPQRAWLTRNCNEETHVLNCFAHCGGFSIAAATAGASTTSIDLSKKWLDRVQPQLEANGVPFDDKHDCIFGDCFDWLAKLEKRGEKYDIVILDPPSASVGGKKKKRWSIKKDMPELVALAAKVVKKGGLLLTTTNSASLSPVKFARLCRRGLEDAGLGSSAKLERIQPMPHDFPSVGAQPVKNLVWRLN
ncbi:large subunit methyltransferase I [Seminavis robusta]|uniref:Large subunit methyltransferase I n=1 Tax=Seminavis robusta TaxID=568900 RepID=A0A9N8EFK2_9STRA|nr:large subunit methyltransferase I [Seminavis robusta]|eukprot:Sro1121_g243420.1 large subunit methyltransferase I (1079) ;mRNA; r:22737-26067